MPAVQLSATDLQLFVPALSTEKADEMIAGAIARAARVAPCILADSFPNDAAAKDIIRGALIRAAEAGSGAVQQKTTGPFATTIDTRTPQRTLFWPTEITELQELCKQATEAATSALPRYCMPPPPRIDPFAGIL